MIKALVFDFDGLILDTEGPIFQAWQELYQEYGGQLTLADWENCLGSAEGTQIFYDNLEGQLGEPVDMEAIAPRLRAREMEMIDAQPILPGVSEYIQRAQQLGLKLGVASSSTCAWVTGHLEKRGLRENFQCVLGSDDVRGGLADRNGSGTGKTRAAGNHFPFVCQQVLGDRPTLVEFADYLVLFDPDILENRLGERRFAAD